MAVLSGALIFVVVLFLDFWASVGYWFVVGPIVGIVAERALRTGSGVRLRGRPDGPGDDPVARRA